MFSCVLLMTSKPPHPEFMNNCIFWKALWQIPVNLIIPNISKHIVAISKVLATLATVHIS
jgi:hypothetical protein